MELSLLFLVLIVCFFINGLRVYDDTFRWKDGRPMSELKVCFVGCAKDCAHRLRKTLNNLVVMKSMFHMESKIFVAENDSTDSTKSILNSFPDVTVLEMDGLELHAKRNQMEREEVLAVLRNKLLDVALETCSHFDFLINVDLDGFLDELDTRQVERVIKDRTKWDVVFANSGKQGTATDYYDVYALRSKALGVDFCVWDLHRHASYTFGPGNAVTNFVEPYHTKIKTAEMYIPVESAFNGLGIYRMSMLRGCHYSAHSDKCTVKKQFPILAVGPCKSTVCEHVPFNQCLHAKGARMFIATGLLLHH